MTVLSFLNDLGIIPNEGSGLENNSNLLQGQKYMEYGRVYQKSIEPHLNNLQITSLPNVDSVIEGMHAVKSSSAISKTELSSYENEFNKTMLEYSFIYKQLSEQGHIQDNSNNVRESSIRESNIRESSIRESSIKLLKKLEDLNKKLIYLSEQIVKEVERSAEKHKNQKRQKNDNRNNMHNMHTIDEIHRKIYEKKKNFNEYIHRLKEEQKHINTDYLDTLTGQEESSKFNLVSNLYILALLILLIFVIIFLFINVQTSSSSNTETILIVLICLLAGFYIKNNYL